MYDNDDYDEFFVPDDVRETYNTTEVPPAEGVPDGIYSMAIERMNTRVTRKQIPILKWQLRILGPQYRDTREFKTSFITAKGVIPLKRDIERCGVHLVDLNDLPEILFEFIDRVVEVEIKTNGEYRNANIRRLLAESVDDYESAASNAPNAE